eukprot:CAMPEP_0173449006 /NCGR_PEP_ID=MMETSP1357-20121228/41897_1 /TAXON_ID=77926 /ORGANISM="Hemiselmis rufescens, Strain PCC563" /LENGTH=72 /DNA_ID=CAMNT_0014415557 /DNA_START=17 /DNA_END=231 /DNA_ORIENTATION=+
MSKDEYVQYLAAGSIPQAEPFDLVYPSLCSSIDLIGTKAGYFKATALVNPEDDKPTGETQVDLTYTYGSPPG